MLMATVAMDRRASHLLGMNQRYSFESASIEYIVDRAKFPFSENTHSKNKWMVN